MPFLLGVYTVPEGSQAVEGNIISPAAFNALLADLATALSAAVLKDGTQIIAANLPMAGFKLTGLGNGTSLQDAATIANLINGTGVYVPIASVGGTGDAITLTPAPAITAYAEGQVFEFFAQAVNTTAVTVNVSGLGAKAVEKAGGTALSGGDIPDNALVHLRYDGTKFLALIS